MKCIIIISDPSEKEFIFLVAKYCERFFQDLSILILLIDKVNWYLSHPTLGCLVEVHAYEATFNQLWNDYVNSEESHHECCLLDIDTRVSVKVEQ